jgi:hypothetical protein
MYSKFLSIKINVHNLDKVSFHNKVF